MTETTFNNLIELLEIFRTLESEVKKMYLISSYEIDRSVPHISYDLIKYQYDLQELLPMKSIHSSLVNTNSLINGIKMVYEYIILVFLKGI